MILHVFVDTAIFTGLPENATTISLRCSVDKEKSLDVISPVRTDSEIIIISKTLHIPLLDDVSKTSEIEIEAVAYNVDGRSIPQGRGSTTVSPIEHGIAKQVNFNNGNQTTGNVTFSVYYYRFPMDINDFQQNEQVVATEQQQKFMKEYSFLQKRRLRWGDGKTVSWNSNSERLLAEDSSIAANRDLAMVGCSQTKKTIKENLYPYGNAPSNTKKKKETSAQISARKSKPKLRKTCLSATYGGVEWPHNSDDQEEKLLQKLHIAEQKRLQLIQTAAEETRQRNIQVEKKIQSIKQSRTSISPQEHQRLKLLLREKEESLQALRAELMNQKNTHRKAHRHSSAHPRPVNTNSGTRRGAKIEQRPPSSQGSNSALRASHQRSGNGNSNSNGNANGNSNGNANGNSNGRKTSKRPAPAYLAPTACWASKSASLAPPRSNNSNSNNRYIRLQNVRTSSATVPRRRRRVKKACDKPQSEQFSAPHCPADFPYDQFPLSLPLDVFHDGDMRSSATSSTSSTPLSSASLALGGSKKDDLHHHHYVASDSHCIEDIIASKSATAISLIQEIKDTQAYLMQATSQDAVTTSEEQDSDKESNLNKIIEKYSSSPQHPREVLDVSIPSTHRCVGST
jgi:hypothetical protein